jgi:hypothetical protein
MRGILQEDIRSLLPEALELIRNKLDVLRASQLDGFESTQLDALQLDVRSPGLSNMFLGKRLICGTFDSSA